MADTPEFQHPDYEANHPRWTRCRDVVAGQDAVHASGVSYLPALSNQDTKEYDAYKKRTPFFNAAARTVDGMVGLVFRKNPISEAPLALEPVLEDVTLTGVPATVLAHKLIQEVEVVGRVGVLVEYPRMSAQPTTLAEARALNMRPYATIFAAESIINWRVQRVNNQMMPVLVVLKEQHQEVGQFEVSTQTQIRALVLDDGVYKQRVYRQENSNTAKSEWVLVDEIVPVMNGVPMRFIPFQMVNSDSLSFDVSKPPLLDLVDLNLSHYRTTADLEHGAHFTGLPTPFIAGLQLEDGAKITIGSATAIIAPDPQATATYLEFTGQGLQALEALLTRKEAQMAAIGARMLAPEKSGVEAAQTMEIKRAGETSVLASQANIVSMAMERILEWMAQWMGISGEISYQLNTDYMPVRMTGQDLTALVSSWQSGAISKATLFYNLQAGEVIAPGKTLEEEQGEIELEAPALGTLTDANG